MSDGNELPRTLSTAIPAIPVPPAPAVPTATEDDARARIAALEREARALGSSSEAAVLYHEMGLLWEHRLRHPRNAAVAYQAAFKLAPRFLANIRAARRLFAEVGNWVMVVQLLDAELGATENPRGRASLLFEKAQVLEQRLSREVDATASLAAALALDPQDATVLVQLEQVYGEKADYPSLVKVYQLLARSVSDDGARAQYLTSAGLLLEDRLKDFAAAAALFREAFALERRDPQLLAAIKRVAHREGTPDEELSALAAEAEGLGPMAAPTFLQIAKAYERLGRPEDALAALLAARRVSPGDPLVLSELARIYEGQGRFAELADVLLAWVGANSDEADDVAINLRLAALYEEQLKRDADAEARYRAILTRAPGNASALAGLGKLFYRAQNWAGLVETYEAEAAATDDQRQRAARLYKAGETLEERLDRVDDAIVRYDQCLSLSPGFLPAQKALIRLYEKLGRWAELVTMYEQDLLQTTDVEQQVSTLNKIATLYEDRLNDVPQAIDSLKRVLDLSPDHVPTMRNLGRLHERLGHWHELLALNDAEAKHSNDTKHVVSLAHRNAEIIEEQLEDRPAAIGAWERVLQLAPTYLPALRALGRLYGQDGRWDALVKMYRAEAEISPSTDQAASLIYKIGELYEHKLKDQAQAIASYREVLTLAPAFFPALRALARIYRAQGEWESMIEILHAEAANRTDPNERANAMFQVAALWEDQLGKPQQAIEGYQEVLRLSPTHASALHQLERLLTARDDVKELIVLLDRQAQVGAGPGRVASYLKLARLYLDRLNEAGRAATCCEAALALDAGNLPALRLLERIRANDRTRRAELRARIAEVVGDRKLAAALRLSAEAPDGLSPTLLAQLRAAAAADPADEALGSLLERALTRARDAQGLIELYHARRGRAADATDAAQLSLRIAELYEQELRDLPRAVQELEALLAVSPQLYPALVALSRCCAALGDVPRARAALEQIAQHAKDPGTVTQAWLDAARLARDVQRDPDAAAALLKQVLEHDPLHPDAGPMLEELLASRGGAPELAALYERRAEVKLSQQDLYNAGRDYYAAARIWVDRLKDADRALGALDRGLSALPTHPEALELKGALCTEAGDWAGAVSALAVRVQQGGDARHLAALHLKLGGIYADHLHDGTRAAAHLQTALASDPGNVEALERLASIHTASRNWTGAADCLRRLLELEHGAAARARHTLALARIADEGFADAPQAVALYRQALELVPGDEAAVERLAVLYERTGSLDELAGVLEHQALQAADPKQAAALKAKVGQLYARPAGDSQRAITAWRQVIDLDPTNVPAHVALAELFARDPSSLPMAIETHRALLRLDPTRVESVRALFRAWESLRQADRAFCAAGVLTFLRAADGAEQAFYADARNRLPGELKGALTAPELTALHHPAARSPLVDVLRAIGDQFVKLSPPQFELLGVDRKADRLRSDHALFKALAPAMAALGVEAWEAYQARRGLVLTETTEPLSVIIGPDLIRRFNVREQRFLFGRAALAVADKAALVRKLPPAELADVLGNSVRISEPEWMELGRRSEEQSKQLRKAYSRRALKVLEEAAGALVAQPQAPSLEATVAGLAFSGDRAGLLLCADVAAGLGLMLREEAPPGAPKPETAEATLAAVRERADVRELVPFALSDDFFRLRQRLGTGLP